MKKMTKKEMVEQIYANKAQKPETGINEMVITEALAVATEPCMTNADYFRVLSALNLLNAAIKDRRWKFQLSYGFIKGRASQLFDQWVGSPVEGVRSYYDAKEGAVFFQVDGVVFSYHCITQTTRTRAFIQSAANRVIEWAGIRLQRIPVEVFDLALAS